MPTQPPNAGLGRREREILDAVFKLGSASVAEVLDELADPPSYSSVRKMLAILEEKGHLRHALDGRRYVYSAVREPRAARRSALHYMLDTFFGGSEEQLVAMLVREGRMTEARRTRLRRLIDEPGRD